MTAISNLHLDKHLVSCYTSYMLHWFTDYFGYCQARIEGAQGSYWVLLPDVLIVLALLASLALALGTAWFLLLGRRGVRPAPSPKVLSRS